MPWLLVGLGNPGARYAGNRHNVGFMVADEVVRRARESYRTKFNGELSRVRLAGAEALVLKPMTFMNRSGVSVGACASFFKASPAETIVVHDELDVGFGTLRLKTGGGHAGHNGLRSLFEHFGKDFVRLRVGIGRPPHGDAVGWVLSDFAGDDRADLPDLVTAAADAVELVLREGPALAMNTVNRRASALREGRGPVQD